MRTLIFLPLVAFLTAQSTQAQDWYKIPEKHLTWVSQDLHIPVDSILTYREADTLTITAMTGEEIHTDSWTIKPNGKLKLHGKKTRSHYYMEFGGAYLMISPMDETSRTYVYCPRSSTPTK